MGGAVAPFGFRSILVDCAARRRLEGRGLAVALSPRANLNLNLNFKLNAALRSDWWPPPAGRSPRLARVEVASRLGPAARKGEVARVPFGQSIDSSA